MNILIGSSIQADCCYEEKYIIEMLSEEIMKKGHKTETFSVPYYRDILALPEQIAAYNLMDVSEADMLITIGYPACFIPHNNKIIYLLERVPRLYEYLNSEYGVLEVPEYTKIRHAVIDAERKCFSSCNKLICGSVTLADDIREYHGLDVEVSCIPPITFDKKSEIYGETYILIETCLMPEDRLEIVFEAVKNTPGKLVIYIPRYGKIYRETLDRQLDDYGIKDKTVIFNCAAPDEAFKKADYFISMKYESRRISNGIVRALKNSCSVIVASDGAAELEFVRNGHSLICDADAGALSEIINGGSKINIGFPAHNLPDIKNLIDVMGII